MNVVNDPSAYNLDMDKTVDEKIAELASELKQVKEMLAQYAEEQSRLRAEINSVVNNLEKKIAQAGGLD
jgi:phage shock protein A